MVQKSGDHQLMAGKYLELFTGLQKHPFPVVGVGISEPSTVSQVKL